MRCTLFSLGLLAAVLMATSSLAKPLLGARSLLGGFGDVGSLGGEGNLGPGGIVAGIGEAAGDLVRGAADVAEGVVGDVEHVGQYSSQGASAGNIVEGVQAGGAPQYGYAQPIGYGQIQYVKG